MKKAVMHHTLLLLCLVLAASLYFAEHSLVSGDYLLLALLVAMGGVFVFESYKLVRLVFNKAR